MKRIIALLVLCPAIALAGTNTLQLTWVQPPGYTCQLYTATNIAGTWTALTEVTNPPTCVQATQSMAFFYVTMAPTNQISMSLAGNGDPTNDVPPGATYIDVIGQNFWVNLNGGSGGWLELQANTY